MSDDDRVEILDKTAQKMRAISVRLGLLGYDQWADEVRELVSQMEDEVEAQS